MIRVGRVGPTISYNDRLTLHSLDELVGNMADLEERIGMVLVVSEEVKHTQTQHVKGQTNVAIVVEPVQHLHTHTVGG